MKRTSIVIAIVLTGAIVHSAWAQSQRRSKTDPAEWVPADAVAYLGITDTERLWNDFKKTTSYKELTDEDLAEAPGSAKTAGRLARKFKERVAKMLAAEPDELKNPFAGLLAAYVTVPPGGGAEDIEPTLIAGVGDRDLMESYFDVAVNRLKETAEEYEAVSAGPHTIHVFTSPEGPGDEAEGDDDMDLDDWDDDAGGMFDELLDKLFLPENMPDKLALCLARDRLIVARSPEQVKATLARKKGDETLAKADDHQALLQHLRPIGEVRLLINLPRVFELMRADASDDGDLKKALSIIGAGSLRSAVGHLRLGTRSYDGKLQLLFLMKGERTGLAKLLSMENRAVKPADSVSSSTSVYLSLNVNPRRLLDEILAMIAHDDPEMAGEFRADIEEFEMPTGEQVDLLKELINHLAEPLTLGAGFARPYQAGALRILATIGHRDQQALMRFFSRMPDSTTREFRGTQIIVDPSGMSAVAVTGDRVLLGLPSSVEAGLAGDETQGLCEDPTFKRALRLVPKEAWGVLYVDEHRLLEALGELAANPDQIMGDPVLMPLMMVLQMSGVDFSDTAKTERMIKYSSATIVTVSQTSEGVKFTLVELKPAEE